MALSPRLELRQGQSLVMTPQLQQAIKLLQLSNLELAAYVEQELEKNPLLERDEAGLRDDEADHEPRERVSDDTGNDPISLDKSLDGGSEQTILSDLDASHDDLYTNESRVDQQEHVAPGLGSSMADWAGTRGGGGHNFDDESGGFESSLSNNVSLRDHLMSQMNTVVTHPVDRLIAAYLIDLVDDRGYIPPDLGSAAERLGCGAERVETVLAALQTLEPTGVMARSLAECLTIQLADRGLLDEPMRALLDNLDLLARGGIEELARHCGVCAEDAADMVAVIRTLTPKPGLAFGSEIVQPVVPDVHVRERPDGGWHVELNSETLPRVLVNSRYYAEVSKSARAEDAKAYLTECFANANWLVKSLDQRARTILKVSSEIVRQQDAFLVHGVQHLKPLNLKTVADAISMHESTVSRVTSNKYIATPRGVFELKYFFTSSIASAEGGEAHSAEAVRHRIKALIEAETADAVLSDDRIVELLREAGIDIARRTVAKYREALRIPSSVERRRLKKRYA
jgi:RNA polymerase sigma-54 factor